MKTIKLFSMCTIFMVFFSCSASQFGTNSEVGDILTPASPDTKMNWESVGQIRNLDVVDEQNIWIVTTIDRRIFGTEDGGQNWSNELPLDVTGVYAADMQKGGTGWLVDDRANVWHKKAPGEKWEKRASLRKSVNDPGFIMGLTIHFETPERGWILETFRFFLTNDGGENWRSVELFEKAQPVKMASIGNKIWVLGQGGGWIGLISEIYRQWR